MIGSILLGLGSPQAIYFEKGFRVNQWEIGNPHNKMIIEHRFFVRSEDRTDYYIRIFDDVFPENIIKDAMEIRKTIDIKYPSSAAMLCLYISCKNNGINFKEYINVIQERLKRHRGHKIKSANKLLSNLREKERLWRKKRK